MRYEAIYFDLDGTLTDSGPGITNSVAYALTRMGRPVPSRPSLNRYIGPPLWDSFRRYEAMTEAETQQAVMWPSSGSTMSSGESLKTRFTPAFRPCWGLREGEAPGGGHPAGTYGGGDFGAF